VKHSIALTNPKLWWPNGYGDPNLYDVELKFESSDTTQFKAGIRQFTYSKEGGALRFWIIYTDNYIALMPGEARVIRTELENADTRGERPTMVVEGFNIQDAALN
jgi:hypothetical protein